MHVYLRLKKCNYLEELAFSKWRLTPTLIAGIYNEISKKENFYQNAANNVNQVNSLVSLTKIDGSYNKYENSYSHCG